MRKKYKMKPLKRKSRSELAKCKDRIQSLLRQICILRDGGCVLRNYPEAGQCGGYRDDGELILQAEHLITRERNISYGDMRNIVCLCKYHHGYWKPQHSRLYWDLIRKVIGEKRWEWLKRVEADKKSYTFGIWEWNKIEIWLKKELSTYET